MLGHAAEEPSSGDRGEHEPTVSRKTPRGTPLWSRRRGADDLPTGESAASRIATLRRVHNIGYAELGILIDKPGDMVCAWELGTEMPDPISAKRLAILAEVVARHSWGEW